MVTDLRVLVALGLTLLLVMLRVEAARFGAAEYDEPVRGRRPSALRRIAWYIVGVGGVLGLLVVHPTPEFSLHLQVGDPSGILIALLLGGLGVGQAIGLAWYHYRPPALSRRRRIPGRSRQRDPDRVHRRGRLPRRAPRLLPVGHGRQSRFDHDRDRRAGRDVRARHSPGCAGPGPLHAPARRASSASSAAGRRSRRAASARRSSAMPSRGSRCS